MPLETATYIDGLNASNPAASDAISSADDHMRLIKSTIKATFPNVAGAVTKTHSQLNNALDKTGDTMTGALTLSGPPTSNLHAATKAYVDATASAAGYVPTARTISTGTGLSGGGDLSANRTLSIANTGVSEGTYGSSSAIPRITVNAQGQITSVTTQAPAVPTISFGTEQSQEYSICNGSNDPFDIKAPSGSVLTGVAVKPTDGSCGRLANYFKIYYRSISVS